MNTKTGNTYINHFCHINHVHQSLLPQAFFVTHILSFTLYHWHNLQQQVQLIMKKVKTKIVCVCVPWKINYLSKEKILDLFFIISVVQSILKASVTKRKNVKKRIKLIQSQVTLIIFNFDFLLKVITID